MKRHAGTAEPPKTECRPARRAFRRPGEAGFTYIAVLIAVTMMGVMLAAAGETWYIGKKREQERELLFVGEQFRKAIGAYYLASSGAVKHYPHSLEELLKDPRTPAIRRYLRKIYPDPITGTTDWGLVTTLDGEIMGVYSQSEDKPLKTANFQLADQGFENGTKYSDWAFVFRPKKPVKMGG